jgi:hypothetical protein
MRRTFEDLVADLTAFQPDGDDWRPLAALVDELAALERIPDAAAELLAVFERFPESDGAGVFWSVVQGLEADGGYEPALIRSVRRRPSEFGVIMVGRLMNFGLGVAGEMPLLPFLETVAADPEVPERARRAARKFVERQVGQIGEEDGRLNGEE